MHTFLTTVTLRKPKMLAAVAFTVLCLLAMMPQVGFAQADPPPPANANPKVATTNEDTLVAIDTGIQADPRYQVVIVSPGPNHGTIVPGGSFPSNFIINYTPGPNKTTPVSFSYQICTVVGTPACGQSALVTVIITPVNDGPQVGADAASVKFGQSVLINVLANDNGGPNEIDSVTLIAGGVSSPTPNGTAVIEGNQIRYTAPAAIDPCTPSPATFTYLVQDGSGLQASGTVTVSRTCPGTPTLKLGPPYAFSNHTFKIDVILESADVNVAAVDFYLGYDTCLTDVDSPTNNMIADDVTNMPAAPNFVSQAQDQPYPGTLHFISAGVLPNAILAGPTNTTRTVATMQFKAQSVCTPPFTFGANPGFTGIGGTPITGVAVNSAPTLTGANNTPTNITLSNNKVAEGSPFNTFIGQFTATDPDGGDTFIFAFGPPPPASNGNSSGKFRIRPQLFNNDELAVQSLATVAPGIYNISVSVTDSFGGTFTKDFAIEVVDANLSAPVANDDGSFSILGRTEIPFANLVANDIDTDDGDPDCDTCSIQSVTNGLKGLVTNLGSKVVYIPTDPKFYVGSPSYPSNPTASDTFTYILTDNDPAGALTDSATVTVNVQRDFQPGNCNGSIPAVNLGIEAGDLTATGLEIFDGDGNLWYEIYKGSYTNFSAYGCNSNQDNVVDAGDIACTAAKIFNPALTCAPVTSANNSAATLTISGDLSGAPGSTVNVPISLASAGNSVAAAAFAVDFDSAALSFDSTDANSDGLPDAVQFNVPSGLMTSATYNAAESRVEIIITGLMPPFPLLSDGTIATVSLTINGEADDNATSVALSNGSLGSDEGASIPVEVVDGTIDINGQSTQHSFYLPLITAE